ncbi:class I SAM-dependent methyltransferase [Longimicrobium sp.]|jgi:hypothetical protein|uniref:class I SAM-dependent methyltransferase n=1 Tax=Longimicrobium sp. TaxID=2029185 RepID=UPI002EDA9398
MPKRPRALVRFFLWEQGQWSRLQRILNAIHTGVWLGVLSRETMDEADEAHFSAARSYNNEAHNLRGLFDWEAQAVADFFAGRRTIGVIAAGAGREVIALSRQGFQAEGFECNPGLVAYAGDLLPRHGCQAAVRLIARDAAPAGAGPYDGIILGWSAYMLIPGRERRIRFLRDLRPLLTEGSPVLLSFFTRPDHAPRLALAFRVARVLRRVLRREPPALGDDLAPMFVHRFNEAELVSELAEAGFTLARFTPEGRGPYDSGWAVAYVAAHENPTPATASRASIA